MRNETVAGVSFLGPGMNVWLDLGSLSQEANWGLNIIPTAWNGGPTLDSFQCLGGFCYFFHILDFA